jgi:hypothetical protein
MEPPSIMGPALDEAIAPDMVRTPTPQTDPPPLSARADHSSVALWGFAPLPPALAIVLGPMADNGLRLEALHVDRPTGFKQQGSDPAVSVPPHGSWLPTARRGILQHTPNRLEGAGSRIVHMEIGPRSVEWLSESRRRPYITNRPHSSLDFRCLAREVVQRPASPPGPTSRSTMIVAP